MAGRSRPGYLGVLQAVVAHCAVHGVTGGFFGEEGASHHLLAPLRPFLRMHAMRDIVVGLSQPVPSSALSSYPWRRRVGPQGWSGSLPRLGIRAGAARRRRSRRGNRASKVGTARGSLQAAGVAVWLLLAASPSSVPVSWYEHHPSYRIVDGQA